MTELDIIKHEKEIFSTISKKGIGASIKKILFEIVIIVVAVSLSIILHGLEKHYEESKRIKEFFLDTKINLKNDYEILATEKKKALQSYNSLIENLENNKYDKVNASLVTGLNLNNTGFEVFKISGDFSLIKNRDLKEKLLDYYQKNIFELTEVEKIYNNESLKLMDFIVLANGKDSESNVIYKKRSLVISQFYLIRISIYDRLQETNKKLTKIIDEELK